MCLIEHFSRLNDFLAKVESMFLCLDIITEYQAPGGGGASNM
jgi:hypothetical protein